MRAHERRRLVVAATLTAVALPALWLFDGSEADDSAAPATAADADAVASDPGASAVPVYLDDTTPVVAPAVIDIAVPERPGAREANGRATFKQYLDAPVERPCTTSLAPTGVELTITNIDNGHSTTCTNTRSVTVPPGADIAIDTEVYIVIGELVEAPVPVRINW